MIDLLTSRIRDVPDFPKPGIVFKDITPLLADAEALGGAVDTLAERVAPLRPEIVLGAESRGFILGPALAIRLGVGFAIARKPGKLPWSTVDGELRARVRRGQPRAARRRGPRRHARARARRSARHRRHRPRHLRSGRGDRRPVVGCAFLIELAFLGGRERLAPFPVESLISYSSED